MTSNIVSHIPGGWGGDRQARVDAAEVLAKEGWSPERIKGALGLELHEQQSVRAEVIERHRAFGNKIKELTRNGVNQGMDGGLARRQAEIEGIKWFTQTYGRKPDSKDLAAGGIRLA